MLSNRLEALLKESAEFFPQDQGVSDPPKTWTEVYGLDKYAFVDAATAGAGMPPGGDPAAMGMPPGGDPAAMGGAPPMDPAAMGAAPPPGMDPAAAAAGGGMPPMDPAAMAAGGMPMDPAAMAAGGLPAPPTGEPTIDPNTGQPIPPKVKVDTNAVLLQLLRLVALMADYLKIPVPASLMTVMPQELMSLPQQPPSGSSSGGGGGAGGGGEAAAGGGEPSAIPPIEPIEPIAPAMPKQGDFDSLIGRAEALKLKQGW